jgi:hypothetical protein
MSVVVVENQGNKKGQEELARAHQEHPICEVAAELSLLTCEIIPSSFRRKFVKWD